LLPGAENYLPAAVLCRPKIHHERVQNRIPGG
jgi:hypothetical protein